MPTKTYFISDDTEICEKQLLESCIKNSSLKYGIEEALIKAIIKKESGFEPFARRNDKRVLSKQDWFIKALKNNGLDSWEYYYSVGYMQVLLIVARLDLGYSGDYYLLFDPAINIDLGSKLLARQIKRYGGDIKRAISAYNAGHYTERNARDYTDIVYAEYKKLGGKK